MKRRQFVENGFKKAYDKAPVIWVQAPGRVDLMGSHTDYNEGYVLTEAIDRNTWIAARPRSDRMVTVRSMNVEGTGEFSLNDVAHDAENPWTNYVRGVADILQQEGYILCGFDGLVHSTIPFGSGLSSSAALEVATAVVFATLADLIIDKVELARICQRAENEFVGLNSGILDQYSSMMGEAGRVLLLDCRSISSKTMSLAPDLTVMICETRAERALTGSEYPARRADCEKGVALLNKAYPKIKTLRDISSIQFQAERHTLPDVVARRCQFVIEENQRVLDMAEVLAEGDQGKIQELMLTSYDGARVLYEIVTPGMEAMMQAMIRAPGVIGARQAGAGFGGCMVAIIQSGFEADFAEHVIQSYQALSGIEARVYPVAASEGAGVIDNFKVQDV